MKYPNGQAGTVCNTKNMITYLNYIIDVYEEEFENDIMAEGLMLMHLEATIKDAGRCHIGEDIEVLRELAKLFDRGSFDTIEEVYDKVYSRVRFLGRGYDQDAKTI